jgi:DNA-binding beta-propeller fold protein YncE
MTIDTAPTAAPETTAPPGQGEGDVAGEAAPRTMKNRKKKIATLVVLLLILAALFGWYWFNRKPFTELPGLSVAKVPHYQSSIYGVKAPMGVAVTASGDRVYVTESEDARVVRIFDRSGEPVGTLKPPASTGASHTPVYLAINPVNNDVYVSDRLAGSVYVYDEKGTYLRKFAPKGNLGAGWAPLGLTFGPDGSLYVTDVGGKTHRVLVFSPDGTLLRSMGMSLPTPFAFPNGILVDNHGNIEVSDGNNGRLLVFDPAGKVLATINPGVGEGDLGLPRGLAVDDASRLFVVDANDHMVRVYDASSPTVATPTFIGGFGGFGQADGMFQFPNSIATDKRAHVYVTDRENNRVQVWGY